MSTVLKPREIPKAINASISEIPVTISAFNMGMLEIPIKIFLDTGFMWLMERAVTVPMTVATSAEIIATSSVVYKAYMIARLWNICVYQLSVKPPQWVLDFDWLKERTIMVKIGA